MKGVKATQICINYLFTKEEACYWGYVIQFFVVILYLLLLVIKIWMRHLL